MVHSVLTMGKQMLILSPTPHSCGAVISGSFGMLSPTQPINTSGKSKSSFFIEGKGLGKGKWGI